MQAHPDFLTKVTENKDEQNRDLVLKKILNKEMSKQRRNELELYKLYVKGYAFYNNEKDVKCLIKKIKKYAICDRI